ncbi:MAG: hypothetical protein IJ316_02745 [Clostridia bacterium]|nr:hypothetical protein [Clostridia bacterium]
MKKYGLLFILCMMFSALSITVCAEDVIIMENNCETEIENATLMKGAPDKSSYYHVEGGIDIGHLPYETSSDYLYELDIRFNNEGAGFSFMKKGKWNSCIRVKDGNFALQTGGNNFTKYTPVDFGKWYHLTFLGRTNRDANPVTYGHIILEEYNSNGERVNKQVFNNVNLRNNAATHYINVFGCDIDNLKAYTPSPTKLILTSDGESIVAGGSIKFSVAAFWNDLEMNGINSSLINFEVYDETNQYVLEDANITISPDGEFKTEPLTPAQKVTVRVTSKVSDLSESLPVTIISGDVFTINGIGMNETGDKVTRVKVNKNFASYKDVVTFVVAFYANDGTMINIGYKTIYAENLAEGENEVSVDISVPIGFDWANGKVKAFAVTTLTGGDKEAAVKVTKDALPQFDSLATLVTIKEDSDISNLSKEDILYFDVIPAGSQVTIPNMGTTYVFSSVNKIDTLFEIIK